MKRLVTTGLAMLLFGAALLLDVPVPALVAVLILLGVVLGMALHSWRIESQMRTIKVVDASLKGTWYFGGDFSVCIDEIQSIRYSSWRNCICLRTEIGDIRIYSCIDEHNELLKRLFSSLGPQTALLPLVKLLRAYVNMSEKRDGLWRAPHPFYTSLGPIYAWIYWLRRRHLVITRR